MGHMWHCMRRHAGELWPIKTATPAFLTREGNPTPHLGRPASGREAGNKEGYLLGWTAMTKEHPAPPLALLAEGGDRAEEVADPAEPPRAEPGVAPAGTEVWPAACVSDTRYNYQGSLWGVFFWIKY